MMPHSVAASLAALGALGISVPQVPVPEVAVLPLHKQMIPIRDSDQTVNAYYGTIFAGGGKPQEFAVVFDTGSGNVIVPSTKCGSSTCRSHRRYEKTRSPFALDVDADGSVVAQGKTRDQVTVEFGTGEITGDFTAESICLGPSAPKVNVTGAVEAQNQCVPLRLITAIAMSAEPFQSFAFDGVFGLGLDALALNTEFGFVGTLARSGRMPQLQFGVFLSEDDSDEPSELAVGGHNPERLKTVLSWAPVTQPELGYWQVRVTKLRIGDRDTGLCNSTGSAGSGCKAVVDTGSSLVGVPSSHYDELDDALSSVLPASAPEAFDCVEQGSLPQLHFDLEGGATVTLLPADYAQTAPELLDDDVTRSCVPRLMPLDLPSQLGSSLFIFGEPVLRRYYTVFDFSGAPRVGFGLAKQRSDEPDLPMPAGGLLGSGTAVRGAIAARLAALRRGEATRKPEPEEVAGPTSILLVQERSSITAPSKA